MFYRENRLGKELQNDANFCQRQNFEVRIIENHRKYLKLKKIIL